MTVRRLLPLVLGLFPGLAAADCAGEVLLSCPTGGGDVLEVCAGGGLFSYAFGPPGAPDLQLTAAMAQGPVTPWAGVGRAIWSSVTFRNGEFGYEVWISDDRLDESPRPEAGVIVTQGDERIAERTCLPGSFSADPFVLSDMMSAGGYCWDHGSFAWRKGTCP